MRIRIRIGFAFIFITYVITLSSILGGCGAPFKKNWQIHPDPGSKSLSTNTPSVLANNADYQLQTTVSRLSHILIFL